MVDLRKVEHFLAVIEEGGFTPAARRCHITQSGLSGSVKSLEHELGVALLMRTTRRVTATEAGRVFAEEGRRLLAAGERARSAVRSVGSLESGRLVIGSMNTIGSWFDLPGLVAAFHRWHPGIDITLVTDTSPDLSRRVERGGIDVGFVTADEGRRATLWSYTIAAAPYVVVCPSGHRLSGRPSVALAELSEETFIDIPNSTTVGHVVDQVFEHLGATRRVGFEVADIQGALVLIAEGLGVACLPLPFGPVPAEVTFVPLAEPTLVWRLEAITLPPEQRASAASALVALLESQANDEAPLIGPGPRRG